MTGSELPGLISMDSIEFHRFSLNFMNFMDLGGPSFGGLWHLWPGSRGPTRKNVGSENPSKEQGA